MSKNLRRHQIILNLHAVAVLWGGEDQKVDDRDNYSQEHEAQPRARRHHAAYVSLQRAPHLYINKKNPFSSKEKLKTISINTHTVSFGSAHFAVRRQSLRFSLIWAKIPKY